VLAVADRHRGARGLRQLRSALDLYDPGGASPKETWLRLLLIRAGYPRPRTQIPVLSPDGRRWYYLDMGWEDLMLAVEYDGEQHRVDPKQYAYDIQRSEDLDVLGWSRIRVVKENRPVDVLRRVARMWHSKLRTDREIS
jgi:very-short-patch-repair endonuclease